MTTSRMAPERFQELRGQSRKVVEKKELRVKEVSSNPSIG